MTNTVPEVHSFYSETSGGFRFPGVPSEAIWKEKKLEKDNSGLFLASQPPPSWHISGLTHAANPKAEISDLLGSIHIMKRTFCNRWLEFPWPQLKWIPSCPLPLKHEAKKPGDTTQNGHTANLTFGISFADFCLTLKSNRGWGRGKQINKIHREIMIT